MCLILADDWKTMHFPKKASDRGLWRGTDEVDLGAQEKQKAKVSNINMNV